MLWQEQSVCQCNRNYFWMLHILVILFPNDFLKLSIIQSKCLISFCIFLKNLKYNFCLLKLQFYSSISSISFFSEVLVSFHLPFYLHSNIFQPWFCPHYVSIMFTSVYKQLWTYGKCTNITSSSPKYSQNFFFFPFLVFKKETKIFIS